ncbi:MAG: DNA repair protein RecN [Anaerovoracaceae bacterium]|jgi:DNA repair protein RecN (Recombination protein N)
MISHIAIKDFAIIDSISLDFNQGFHIFTGETGSGKSIIIEAISLALGSRADTGYVRAGKDRAVIELTVETQDPEIFALLKENDLEENSTLMITREIHAAGKSVCRINGDLVSVSFLNKLCKKIADIHGQYDHQSLLNPENHIFLVDECDADDILPIKNKVKTLYHSYTDAKKRLNTLISNQLDTERKHDFMKFELEEIRAANLKVGEDTELSENLLLLQNSEMIFETLSTVYDLLYDHSPSSQDGLGKSTQLLSEIESFSPNIASISNVLSDCYYKLEDLQGEIRKARDSISFSPEEINEIIERIQLLDRLKRKYGGSIEKVLVYQEKLAKNLNEIDNNQQLIEDLTKDVSLFEEQLALVCKQLTGLRKQAALKIEKSINEELKELNFKNAELSVIFSELKDKDKPLYSENGTDFVEFFMVTNKGETPKPLAKIASGGEISRMMLAFKRVIGDYDRIPTLIFDEIDSGISGITASIVGKKIKEISSNHQVICITHLAQIASYADHHYRISKESTNKETFTKVTLLGFDERVNEIARLLGGMNITKTTLKNAEELITQSSL